MNADTRCSLIHNALPTIFNVPNPPKRLASTRSEPPVRTAVAVKRARLTVTQLSDVNVSIPTKTALLKSIQSKVTPSTSQTGQVKSRDAQFSGVVTDASNISCSVTALQNEPMSNRGVVEGDLTPQKSELACKLNYANKCLSRARVSLWRLKQKQAQSAKLSEKKLCGGICREVDALPPTAKQFIASQVRALSTSPFGMRWSHQDKLLALGLYYKSPSAYRFMTRTFHLPSERTLQQYISGFNVTTGFDCDYMLALRKRAESLNTKEKHVVVTFDGMSLRSSLKYLEYDDRIVGFEETSGFSDPSSNVAKHVLQFMVRGICTRWKQPIGHFFIGNSVNATVLKKMLMAVVSKLENVGLTVAAVVCDQEASHRSCLTAMNVTVSDPVFKSDGGNTVYVMHDPPHLIKNVRNNLLTYDFIVDGKTVSFKHIEHLYELESKNVLRFVPKLSKGHVQLTNFKKMNVKLATQVLSHSVASGLRCYIKLKQMATEVEATAAFVEKMNRIFDIMNSNSPKTKNKWQKPLSAKTVEQFQELRDAKVWIEGWKFKSRKTGLVKDNLPFKQGFIMTINALSAVCHDLIFQHGFQFVMTSRFNQDVVENWFSCIRGKGRNNDSCTTLEYESASKNIAVNWLLEHPEKGSNCQLDCDSFIGLLKQAELCKIQSGENPGPESAAKSCNTSASLFPTDDRILLPDACNLISDWSGVFSLNDVDKNVVFYIAGYLSRKLNLNTSCKQCQASYVQSRELNKNTGSKHASLLDLRQFEWSKNGLTSPSQPMFDLCCALEKIVQVNIEGIMAGPNVMGSLKDVVASSVTVDSYPTYDCCIDHKSWWLNTVVTVFLRIRIHHFVRVRNRELKELAEARKLKKQTEKKAAAGACKGSRKAKKVMHL